MSERPDPLAEALESLATLLATNPRDWGAHWDDAWLWAILCGWDCEETEHTDTCTHGAMEEMVTKFGWDEGTVAKLRSYRAAVRAASAGPVRPDEEPTPDTRCSVEHHPGRRCERDAGHEGMHENNDLFGLQWSHSNEELAALRARRPDGDRP